MFTRNLYFHPYKLSSPAGFRTTDYTGNPKWRFNLFQGADAGSRASSPLNSPIKGQRQPYDDPPRKLRLGDLVGGCIFGSPKRPSAPTPDLRNATPNVKRTDAPPQDAFQALPRRKNKHGPKHLSFTGSGKVRLQPCPSYRRAEKLTDCRDASRRRLLRRRLTQTRVINRLRREAEALLTSERTDTEDGIFLQQLRKLQADEGFDLVLEQCREHVSRSADNSKYRRLEQVGRDKRADKMWEERGGEDAGKDLKRARVKEYLRQIEEEVVNRRRIEEVAMRADEERQRVHQLMERRIRDEQEYIFRLETTRKAKIEEERRGEQRRQKERKLQEEKDRQLRGEVEHLRKEIERVIHENERRMQAEREYELQKERERKLLEEVNRLRREAHERFVHEEKARLAREEQERQAHLHAEQARRAAQDNQISHQLALYEAKWNELRTSNSIPPIDVREMPWPVLGSISSADQITDEAVRTFLFHPLRPGVEGKTARDKIKSEVLRFHPDKFNTRIIPKIQPSQRAVAQEIAGAIARILTRIMAGMEQQK